MQRLISFVMGMVAGGLLIYWATNYHIVRTDAGFHTVAKARAQLAQAYVDVRTFGVDDWASHPDLIASLVRANKQDLMQGSAANTVQEAAEKILPDWPQQ